MKKTTKKKKYFSLKITKAKDMNLEDEDYKTKSGEDMDLMFHKFGKFLRHEKQTTKLHKQSK